jgi:hypothetical protein
MTTKSKTSPAQKKIDDTKILEGYMNYVLEHHHEPKNVYLFCKEIKITEIDFYSFFSSLEALRSDFWVKIFESTIQTLNNDNTFESFSQREKILTMYFTMFENLSLNRSYVIYALKDSKKGLGALKELGKMRKLLKEFVTEVLDTQMNASDKRIQSIVRPALGEGAWIQFLTILKFWIEDESKGFEKTDVMIEKSLKASFDFIDTTPLESIFDLGKFIWNEKFRN